MGKEVLLKVIEVSKQFQLKHEEDYSLKNSFIRALQSKKTTESFWALKDINLEVKRGEIVGIIGRNGSGKSTLLRLIAGILQPTIGRIEINGSVASLIELGAGFHPDLNGRENIFLNAAILGLTSEKTAEFYQEIVEFTGLEKFIDTPIKYYSAGMIARLGFAISMMSDPDIFLIDEILSVGDIAFQEKCFQKIYEFTKKDRAILLVSHSIQNIVALCDRCILLHNGKLLMDGPAKSVADYYVNEIAFNDAERILYLERLEREKLQKQKEEEARRMEEEKHRRAMEDELYQKKIELEERAKQLDIAQKQKFIDSLTEIGSMLDKMNQLYTKIDNFFDLEKANREKFIRIRREYKRDSNRWKMVANFLLSPRKFSLITRLDRERGLLKRIENLKIFDERQVEKTLRSLFLKPGFQGSGECIISQITCYNDDFQPVEVFHPSENLYIELILEAKDILPEPTVRLGIFDKYLNLMITAITEISGFNVPSFKGKARILAKIENLNLNTGDYWISAGVWKKGEFYTADCRYTPYCHYDFYHSFRVEAEKSFGWGLFAKQIYWDFQPLDAE